MLLIVSEYLEKRIGPMMYNMLLCFFLDCVKNIRMILPFKSKLRDVILLIAIAGSCLYTACGQTQSGKSKSILF